MSKTIDEKGKKYGRLTVLFRNGSDKEGKALYTCRCECGNTCTIKGKYLRTGHTKSCGCLSKDTTSKRSIVHGYAKRKNVERLYKVWLSMKNRCNNPNLRTYKHYGGRGITVCKEWSEIYETFREWAYQNGYDKNAKRGKCTIDRIDVNGDYSPENCRWVDQSTQMRNTRPRERR